jgi:hypothetical protein
MTKEGWHEIATSVQPKSGWIPRNDGFKFGRINQAATRDFKKGV